MASGVPCSELFTARQTLQTMEASMAKDLLRDFHAFVRGIIADLGDDPLSISRDYVDSLGLLYLWCSPFANPGRESSTGGKAIDLTEEEVQRISDAVSDRAQQHGFESELKDFSRSGKMRFQLTPSA